MFELRKDQIIDGSVGSIPSRRSYTAKFVAQEHFARKAGKHYDYGLVIGPRAFSWASRYLLPKTTSQKFSILRQPDHKSEYATFSGTIPEGQYGAGKVSVIFNTDCIVIKSSDSNIKLVITDGEFRGVYSFIKKNQNAWIVVRNLDLTHEYAGKQNYSSKVSDTMWSDPNVIASEKKDGASVIARVTSKKGIGIVSTRKTVKGELIKKDNHVPHISFTKSPKEFDGMVFRGELYLDKYPFSVLSGVLNSKPQRAVEAQIQLKERIKLAPFDILKLPGGKDASEMTYKQKLILLDAFAKYIESEDVKLPKFTTSNKKKFYEDIVANGGEGVVLSHNED